MSVTHLLLDKHLLDDVIGRVSSSVDLAGDRSTLVASS